MEILDNRLKIRLLGIKEIPGNNKEAIQFLREKPMGKRYF
jgi:hypothetical protein